MLEGIADFFYADLQNWDSQVKDGGINILSGSAMSLSSTNKEPYEELRHRRQRKDLESVIH